MAEELNEKGSKAYLEGNLVSARDFYETVRKPSSNVFLYCWLIHMSYYSNLSAVLFDLGTRYQPSTSRANINEDIRKFVERKSKQKEDEKVNELKAWGKLVDGANEAPPIEEELNHARIKSHLPLYFKAFQCWSHTMCIALLLRHVSSYTLVEINPASVARILIIFELFSATGDAKNEEEKDEIFATLIYMYTAMIISDYCVDRLIRTSAVVSKRLSSSQGSGPVILHGYLSIPCNSIPNLIAVLQEWCTSLNKTVAGVLKHNPKLQEPSGGDWRDIAEHDRLIRKETGIDPNDDYRFERRIVEETRGLVPPETLMQCHPALQKLQNTRSFKGLTLKNAKEEVLKTWKPNFILFQWEGMCAHHLFSMKDGSSDTNQHPQSELFDYFYMCMTSSYDDQLAVLLTVLRTTFSVLKQFFTRTITALQTLKGRVTIEVVIEDAISGLQCILTDRSRPKAYPSKFTRMWLSNFP
ncbi:hypothetical protein FA15DRAFT_711448 [Coprinopsis marcescibilis]|uniref:Uncharacterized protein n=1 Tax=Coprinopsis marcescibilis TaxID=230819 RepID=A0A5C3K9X3_COPMA|nr:hypothetical protein FA15DRAFT_711448 [Coprinopsis marcescibilis]